MNLMDDNCNICGQKEEVCRHGKNNTIGCISGCSIIINIDK